MSMPDIREERVNDFSEFINYNFRELVEEFLTTDLEVKEQFLEFCECAYEQSDIERTVEPLIKKGVE